MKLEAVNGGPYASFFPVLLDSYDARDAVHLYRASREALEVQCEPHRRARFKLHVGDEVNAARADVAGHGATVLQPYGHGCSEPLLFSAGHGVIVDPRTLSRNGDMYLFR